MFTKLIVFYILKKNDGVKVTDSQYLKFKARIGKKYFITVGKDKTTGVVLVQFFHNKKYITSRFDNTTKAKIELSYLKFLKSQNNCSKDGGL